MTITDNHKNYREFYGNKFLHRMWIAGDIILIFLGTFLSLTVHFLFAILAILALYDLYYVLKDKKMTIVGIVVDIFLTLTP